jgi:ELWxxDGT repeat protein
LLKDIYPGSTSSVPNAFSVIGNKLYFSAESSHDNSEPWVSDGTTAGTFLLKNLYPGGSSDPRNFSAINNKVVFGAVAPTAGYELYVTKGTASSTKLLKDIFKVPNTLSSYPAMLTTFNNRAYFFASTGDNSNKLYKTNGKAPGTELVYDFGTGTKTDYGNMVVFKNKLYFTAASSTTNDIQQLWKSDGTTLGTELVYSAFTGMGSYTVSDLTVIANNLFFGADDGVHGKELWKSDGTTAGTSLVKDIYPGENSFPLNLFAHNGICYFTAQDNLHGRELWRSDGTEAGTYMVKEIQPGSGYCSCISDFIASPADPNFFYFAARTTDNGSELYKSDGTDAGTVLIKDINPGSADSDPNDLTVFNGKVFFFASDSQDGNSLWKTDGTASGTKLVKDVYTIGSSGYLSELTLFNGALYFAEQNNDASFSIWKTDGTAAGTVPAIDFTSKFLIDHLYVGGNLLFFNAWAPETGYELYQNDGTQEGTVLVDDENPGAANFSPGNFLFGNGSLLMVGTTEQYSQELYVYTPALRMENNDLHIESSAIVAYPNPFTESFILDLSQLHLSGEQFSNEQNPIEIRITDLSGKILFQKTFSYQDKIEIGNDLPNGFYLVELKGNNQHEIIPVVKE